MINLVEMLESNCGDVKFRASYSGRAMFGKDCIGIVGQPSQLTAVLQETVSELVTNVFERAIDADPNGESDTADEAYDYHDEVQHAIQQLLDYRVDSMGLEVIWYWPSIQYQSSEGQDDD